MPSEQAAASDTIDVLEACGSHPQQSQSYSTPDLIILDAIAGFYEIPSESMIDSVCCMSSRVHGRSTLSQAWPDTLPSGLLPASQIWLVIK